MQLSFDFPSFFLASSSIDDKLRPVIQALVRDIEQLQHDVVDAVNSNETYVKFVSQNAQPTVPKGELWLWEDADATSGNPTHYLVANDGTSTVTFASQELVP